MGCESLIFFNLSVFFSDDNFPHHFRYPKGLHFTDKEWLYSHNPGRGEEEEGITELPQESEKNKMANLSHQKCNG